MKIKILKESEHEVELPYFCKREWNFSKPNYYAIIAENKVVKVEGDSQIILFGFTPDITTEYAQTTKEEFMDAYSNALIKINEALIQ